MTVQAACRDGRRGARGAPRGAREQVAVREPGACSRTKVHPIQTLQTLETLTTSEDPQILEPYEIPD